MCLYLYIHSVPVRANSISKRFVWFTANYVPDEPTGLISSLISEGIAEGHYPFIDSFTYSTALSGKDYLRLYDIGTGAVLNLYYTDDITIDTFSGISYSDVNRYQINKIKLKLNKIQYVAGVRTVRSLLHSSENVPDWVAGITIDNLCKDYPVTVDKGEGDARRPSNYHPDYAQQVNAETFAILGKLNHTINNYRNPFKNAINYVNGPLVLYSAVINLAKKSKEKLESSNALENVQEKNNEQT